MKLNVGCGTDYRDGFINIDGSKSLRKVDKNIDISTQKLTDYFEPNSVSFILANDIIEHHFHWEAVRILKEFYALLSPGGKVEIRVPDVQYIINSWWIPLQKKTVLLYGGQDIPQGGDPDMDVSRRSFPQFFCHKYGWTRETMRIELESIGFKNVRARRARTNFICLGEK